jgi:hypothetical protein
VDDRNICNFGAGGSRSIFTISSRTRLFAVAVTALTELARFWDQKREDRPLQGPLETLF